MEAFVLPVDVIEGAPIISQDETVGQGQLHFGGGLERASSELHVSSKAETRRIPGQRNS
jgi:hypothetical protein